jgi:hypothetical protein
VLENMAARDGIEPPPPAFSGLLSAISPVKSPSCQVDGKRLLRTFARYRVRSS